MPVQIQMRENSVLLSLRSGLQTHVSLDCNDRKRSPVNSQGHFYCPFSPVFRLSFLWVTWRPFSWYRVCSCVLYSCYSLLVISGVSVPTGPSIKSTKFYWNCLRLLKSMESSPSFDTTYGEAAVQQEVSRRWRRRITKLP